MKLFTSIAAFLLPSLAFAAPTAELSTSDKRADLATTTQFQSFIASGSGCPDGTFSALVSPDGKVLTFGFSSFLVAVGSGASPEDREKFCDIFVTIKYPVGCTSSKLDVTYHGFTQVDASVGATFTPSYVLSPGLLGQTPAQSVFNQANTGIDGDVYTRADSLPSRVAVNAYQTNVSLVVRTRAFVNANGPSGVGVFTVDDVTIALTDLATC